MSSGAETRMNALDRVLDASPGSADISDELFSIVDVLDSSIALRRALTDPSTDEPGRQRLAHGIFDGRVSPAAADLVAEAVAYRWAGGRTFTAAIERQAIRSELIKAERSGQLEDTEDALFRFGRVVDSTPGLRNALADRAVGVAERQGLVSDLLEGKVPAATVALARRAVLAKERTYGQTLEQYVNMAASHKDRTVATVRVARELTPDQQERLRSVLSQQVGRAVAIQVIVDESVLGGVRVELGDEVIEGTVADRLGDARRLFS